MKFFVIGDTHGKIEAAEEVYRSLTGVDQIIHLGDYEGDGWSLENRLAIPVITVKGNMDGSNSNGDYKIINSEFGKMYLSHGHMEAVKFSTHNLLYKAASFGCNVALFGHTHVPLYEDVGGIHLVNPGSLTMPKGGRLGSYAVINTGQNTITANIFYWDAKMRGSLDTNSSQCKPVNAGFLRRIFNDSDGQ